MSSNIPPPAGMNQETWNQIQAVIQASIRASPGGPAGPPGPPGPPGNDGGVPIGESRPVVVKSAEDVGYFDPGYEDSSNTNASIVNAGRHVFYRDVYVFVDRIKDLAKGSTGEQKVKELIPGCLNG